jgi:hypothetical protein
VVISPEKTSLDSFASRITKFLLDLCYPFADTMTNKNLCLKSFFPIAVPIANL